MNQENDHKYMRVNKLILLVAVLILGAGLFGWWLGNSNKSQPSQSNNASQATSVNNASTEGVKAIVSYVLPDGWKEASCLGVSDTVYIVPSRSSNVDCNANPSSPVKISVDPGNHTDCNQLQNVQDVKKHICISQYINGHKSLKASTEYLASSSYKQATTINAYYIDTGKGVIKLEYIYNSNDQFQAGFDQLANSVQVK